MIKTKSILAALILTGFMFLTLAGLYPRKAEACCSCAATVYNAEMYSWYYDPNTGGTYPRIAQFITNEFLVHRIWYVALFWEDNLLPALQMMTEQLSAVAMHQAMIIGAFFDAKHQLETQQLFERVRARAHKDYHPSTRYGLCEIGSSAKSLAASDRKAEFNAVFLSQRSQDRNLGNAYTAAAAGTSEDRKSRVKQFREKFCDPRDNNDGLKYFCDHDQDGNPSTGEVGAQQAERMNKDIDFARTVDMPWTINADFTDTALTNQEEEVIALANNLYSHDLFQRPPSDLLKKSGVGGLNNMQKLYMDARSVIAKRSVAENSFNAITSMKAEGLPGSREYLLGILTDLGISNKNEGGKASEVEVLLGMDPNNDNVNVEPSYYAQMEVLTKKIYQNPDFYTNLYDTPANVARKQVAMQAIGLMQKFDLFKSYLRSEASLSILLELAVMDMQSDVEDQINRQTGGN